MTLRPITEAPAHAQAPAGKQGSKLKAQSSKLKAQSSKKDKSYKPLADSWTIFDNSGDVPKMTAFEESGKIEVLDPDLFNILLKYKGNQ